MLNRAKKNAAEFGDIFEPSEAAEPILARPVRGALLEWLEEIWSEQELAAVGIKPRRRAMFDGPPGVGKTTLAHHLSARLGLKMLAMRPDRLIDAYIGSTGRNIGAVFDAAAAGIDGQPIVLFIDEFDAIAVKRREARQGADNEQNGWVNTLLQRIEQYDGFLIAATNFAKHIDQAAWRRFDIHITLELPGQFERECILARYLAPYGLAKQALSYLAESCDTASPALMRAFCENVKRQIVIGPKLGSDMRRDAVIERVLASVHPHPDLGKPALWARGSADKAVQALPWPLPLAADVKDEPEPAQNPSRGNVVTFAKGAPA